MAELEACGVDLETLPEIKTELFKAIGDFKHGGTDNILQGVLELLLGVLQLKPLLHDCRNMGDDMALIETWAMQFTNIKTLLPTLTKHFLFHKAAITADIALIETDYAAGDWFKVGEEAADVLTILLPIQATAEDLV